MHLINVDSDECGAMMIMMSLLLMLMLLLLMNKTTNVSEISELAVWLWTRTIGGDPVFASLVVT